MENKLFSPPETSSLAGDWLHVGASTGEDRWAGEHNYLAFPGTTLISEACVQGVNTGFYDAEMETLIGRTEHVTKDKHCDTPPRRTPGISDAYVEDVTVFSLAQQRRKSGEEKTA